MATLVTGASGFLGQHLVRWLWERGDTVIALEHDAALWSHEKRLIIANGDVRDLELLRRLIARYEVDTVIHLAAQAQVGIGVGNPADTYSVNVTGTLAVLEACRLEKVRRLVVSTSDKVYGAGVNLNEDAPLKPSCPYGTSKAAADLLCQSYAATYGMNIGIARCGNLYGPGDTNWRRLVPHVARAIARGETPQLRSNGSHVRHWLYVGDAVEAFKALAASDYVGAVNFGGNEAASVRRVVVNFSKLTSRDVWSDFIGGAENELPEQSLDSSFAERVLKWKPTTTLADGLSKAMAWYRENCR